MSKIKRIVKLGFINKQALVTFINSDYEHRKLRKKKVKFLLQACKVTKT